MPPLHVPETRGPSPPTGRPLPFTERNSSSSVVDHDSHSFLPSLVLSFASGDATPMSAFDLPLNNPYHAVLYAPSPQPSTSSPTLPRGHATDAPGRLAQHLPPPVSSHSSSSPPSSTMSSAAGSSSSSREDLVLTTPPAVVRFLILSAPFAAAFRRALEVVLWRGKKHARSWSVVVGWWAVCLIGWGIVRYVSACSRRWHPSGRCGLWRCKSAIASERAIVAGRPALGDDASSSVSRLHRVFSTLPYFTLSQFDSGTPG